MDPIFGPDRVIEGDLAAGQNNVISEIGASAEFQENNDSEYAETIFDESEFEIQKQQDFQDVVPESPIFAAGNEVNVVGSGKKFYDPSFSNIASSELNIVGKFWSTNAEQDMSEDNIEEVKHPDGQLDKNDNNSGFTKVLSKSQLKKLRKKNNVQAKLAVVRKTRSRAGQTEVLQ